MKEFTIGTFYLGGAVPRISYVTAYSRWYNVEWDGCMEYTVLAERGADAKRKARELRLEFERGKLRLVRP